ncbi:hypothetical protein LAUMK13_01208 [Mycobacterium innocens]|uniref:Uncharacterized protein n=1 Tax=Mycobacterium innocens TaxID=2341083 RepID=A0A498PW88_9MYCO|nr:hypothetical protein LAUMK13_01208 [Mycobacterium innocens]
MIDRTALGQFIFVHVVQGRSRLRQQWRKHGARQLLRGYPDQTERICVLTLTVLTHAM